MNPSSLLDPRLWLEGSYEIGSVRPYVLLSVLMEFSRDLSIVFLFFGTAQLMAAFVRENVGLQNLNFHFNEEE